MKRMDDSAVDSLRKKPKGISLFKEGDKETKR